MKDELAVAYVSMQCERTLNVISCVNNVISCKRSLYHNTFNKSVLFSHPYSTTHHLNTH